MKQGAAVSTRDGARHGEGPARHAAPATASQREIWLGDKLGSEASAAFNLSKLLRLSGTLDVAALQVALEALVARHDALRTGFSDDGGTMFALDACTVTLDRIDVLRLPPEVRESSAMDHLRRCVEQLFELETPGLFRFHLVRLHEHEHLLLACAHHIVCDGWSWGVLVRELGQLYSLAGGASAGVLPEPESYVEYALREADHAASPRQVEAEAYWLSRFPDVPVLDLPCDRPRGQQRTFASDRVDHWLDAELVESLRRLGAERRAGLFAVLLAGYSLLLSRLTGDASVVVGVPAAGQSEEDREGLVGNCVSLLPVRIDIDRGQDFSGLLDAAQGHLLDALDHQRYTFGSLLQRLAVVRDSGRVPLVSVLLNLEQASSTGDGDFAGLEVDVLSLPRRHEAFELFLNAVRVRDGRLRLECQYNVDLFDAATVEGWLQGFETLLRGAVASTSTPVGALPLLAPDDLARQRALQPAPVPFRSELGVHERFERQCDMAPQRIALSHDGRILTYAELEARANLIAHWLRDAGIGVGDRVGLALPRGPDMLAAVLGVLKSGAAYVPLDPSFPEQRLTFMVGDAGLAGLVTCQQLQSRFSLSDRPVLVLDDPLARSSTSTSRLMRDDRSATSESCAYVIYTSGSTGQPKGVCVPHRAVSNFLEAMVAELGIRADDRMVAVTTLSFDIAVLELLLPLAVGARVVLAGRETAADGAALAGLLARSDATMMQATPATWRMLLDAGWRSRPGFAMLCGGESLPPSLAARLLSGGDRLYNLYGPTETTVWSTCARVAVPPAGERPQIHIGRPIANTQVWIVDRDGQLLPTGVPGEICIGGQGVTLGYHDRPELTADRFIRDTCSAGSTRSGPALVYRTGDRGRWRKDGVLEHLGRLDHQVKLRGFRIELGEIETCALADPGVAQALASVREISDGDVRLLLHVVAPDDFDAQALLETLRASLPDYMLPQHILRLQALPLLPNGKIDRGALPGPEATIETAGEPPRNETERVIVEAMAEVLGLSTVGIHDDFFAHGGHSLLAAQLTARLNRSLGSSLPWRALFDARTPARLAGMAGTDRSPPIAGGQRIVARHDQRSAPLTPAQERLWQLEELEPGRGNFSLPSAHRLKGRLDRDALERALAHVVQRQSVLRTVIDDSATPVQRVLDPSATRIEPTVDLSGLPEAQREQRLSAALAEHARLALDIATRPPFRVVLFRLAVDEHVLFFMAHHILWDGWSTHLLLDELAEAYQATVEAREPKLPPLPVSFGDYAEQQLAWLQGPEYARQRDYWQQRLALGRDARALPHDKPAPATTGRAGMRPVLLDKATVASMRELALAHDATLFMTLLAVWFAVLHGKAGPGDLVVGSPVRGRKHAELEHLMGFFTSLLPLRVQVKGDLSFKQLLQQARAVVLDGFSHPDVLLEDLLPASGRRAPGAPYLYHALLSYQDARGGQREWGGLLRERIPMHSATTAEDVGIWFVEHDDGLWGQLIYNADAFEPGTADWLSERFLSAASAAAADCSRTVAELAGGAVPTAAVAMARATGAQRRPMLGERERLLADIFSELLGTEDLGPEDNFFILGGNSLLALRLIKRVDEATGVRLNLVQLATGTIGSMARGLPEATLVRPSPKGFNWRSLFGRSPP